MLANLFITHLHKGQWFHSIYIKVVATEPPMDL